MGEPIVVKKPKGITSDLKVTGQWGVALRQVMNRTGVLGSNQKICLPSTFHACSGALDLKKTLRTLMMKPQK